MKRKIKIKSNRIYRHRRIRKKAQGTADHPRLCVFRSLKHLEARLVDDLAGKTLLSLSTKDKDFKSSLVYKGNVKAAEQLGAAFAAKAKKNGFDKIMFDRGGYLYHGRVRMFAEAARKAGLNF